MWEYDIKRRASGTECEPATVHILCVYVTTYEVAEFRCTVSYNYKLSYFNVTCPDNILIFLLHSTENYKTLQCNSALMRFPKGNYKPQVT